MALFDGTPFDPSGGKSISPAATDLGLGDMLGEQVEGETEEMRKKRLLAMQQRQQAGPYGSLATTSLFGTGLSPNAGGNSTSMNGLRAGYSA